MNPLDIQCNTALPLDIQCNTALPPGQFSAIQSYPLDKRELRNPPGQTGHLWGGHGHQME